MKKRSSDGAVAVVPGTTRELAVTPELWSAFDGQLAALLDKTKEAEKSYVHGRGMSLASIAVGSALLRLSKACIVDGGIMGSYIHFHAYMYYHTSILLSYY